MIATEFDFDAWRAGYDHMTFEQQKSCYEEMAELYPCQRSFDLYQAAMFFQRYRPKTVVELGGWDGALASSCCSKRMISWRNYDIVAVPQVCLQPAYELVVLNRPLWEFDAVTADAFVATHTIEHLRARELEELVPKLKVKACLIEAPLREVPTDWTGYFGSHILEVGWDGVDALFVAQGFTAARRWRHGRFYEAA